MDIEITYKDLNDAVDEEIARSAARAYSADGTPLFDGMAKTSRDANVMKVLTGEAVTVLQSAVMRFLLDVSRDETSLVFTFDLSGRRAKGKCDLFESLLKSILAKLILSKYFAEKQQADLFAFFDELAAADIKTLTKHMYEKSAPYHL